MRSILFALPILVFSAVGSVAFGQSLLEHSAAAAGGSVGGVAGKKVSDGLTSIFQKIDGQTQKAAKTGSPATGAKGAKGSAASAAPLFEVGPAVPKQRASVPPPPPPLHPATPRKQAPLPLARVTIPMAAPQLAVAPAVTVAELRTVTAGMSRTEVLKLGAPAARVTMYDDGHLLEIYRYSDREASVGTVRLTDGAVSSVQVR